MPSTEVAVEATRAYQTGLQRLQAALTSLLVPAWIDLGNYDRDDVPRWELLISAAVAAHADESTALASGYVSLMTDGEIATVSRPAITADPEIPFLRHWRGLNEGKLWEQSVEEAAGGVGEYSSDVVQSTARKASDEAATEQVVGWRRTLTGSSCEWCALVSTQRYRTAESADFGHANCDCGVTPITGDVDPGRVINSDLLKELKAQGAGDRITQNRRAKRSLTAADNAAARRDKALAALADESDPARIGRLKARANRWDREAEAFRARAAEESARPIKPRLPGNTGYVQPDGSPVARP